MPLYEYRCPDCGVKFEKIVPSASSPVPACPSCGKENGEKLLSVPGSVGVAGSDAGASCPSAASGACSKASGFG